MNVLCDVLFYFELYLGRDAIISLSSCFVNLNHVSCVCVCVCVCVLRQKSVVSKWSWPHLGSWRLQETNWWEVFGFIRAEDRCSSIVFPHATTIPLHSAHFPYHRPQGFTPRASLHKLSSSPSFCLPHILYHILVFCIFWYLYLHRQLESSLKASTESLLSQHLTSPH